MTNDKTDDYTFDIGDHTAQAHDYVSALIDEAYRRKANDSPTTAQERVESSRELTEAHYSQIGQMPSESVLSRLAWYIVFDYYIENNPHKVSAEEYPTLSDYQMQRRRARESTLADVYTGGEGDVTIGRYKDEQGIKRRIYDYMTPDRDMSLIPTEYLDLYNAIDNAGLTDRQRQAIELVYFEGMTLEDVGNELDVSKQAIKQFTDAGIAKIKRYLSNVT